MAALTFPGSPTDGDTYSANNTVWIYNGTVDKWEKVPRGYPDLTSATQAQMEAGTDNLAYVTPSTVKYNIGAAKASLAYNHVAASIYEDDNISSATDNGTGTVSFAFSNNMTNTNWRMADCGGDVDGGVRAIVSGWGTTVNKTSSGWGLSNNNDVGTAQDTEYIGCIVFGDLA